ncbi:MAG: hypothetical protein GY817_07335 [bacterium]|nr:hypothetical protein [bacterium]
MIILKLYYKTYLATRILLLFTRKILDYFIALRFKLDLKSLLTKKLNEEEKIISSKDDYKHLKYLEKNLSEL